MSVKSGKCPFLSTQGQVAHQASMELQEDIFMESVENLDDLSDDHFVDAVSSKFVVDVSI